MENNQSMDDFKEEIAHSFRKLSVGDIVTGTVIGINETDVTVDLNSYAEGIIKADDLSNDPRFSIHSDIKVGDVVKATIKYECKDGTFLLSVKEAENLLSWDRLLEAKAERTVQKVKISEAVKGGVTTYLFGMRAFIPASQLALSYVEDTSSFVGKTLEVYVTEANRDTGKLVLSAKEVLKEKADSDKAGRISKLQTGIVTTGVVEKLMPFGAFVNIGDELTGLVHISQICDKHIKSPAEVLKEGDEVTVKILDVHDGKISLSIKAVNDDKEEEVLEDDVLDAPCEYSDHENIATGLGDLLAKLKL